MTHCLRRAPLTVVVLSLAWLSYPAPALAQDPASSSAPPCTCDCAADDAHGCDASGSTVDEHKPDVTQGPDRVFGVLPNYTTVEKGDAVQPITAKRAFTMAAKNSFDVYVFPFIGVVTALGAGQGAGSYERRYVTALSDNTIGNFMTTAILPSALHQDPRYYERGVGNVWHRAWYAATRSVVTRSRAGHPEFNVSEIGGNALAAVISNAYYPSVDRSLRNTATRWGTQVMWDTLANELKEFWPDIRRGFRRP